MPQQTFGPQRTFGDHALSVVFLYLSPLTWFAVLALLVFWVAVISGLDALDETAATSFFVAILIVVFLNSAILGRFAAGARRGELAAGLLLNGSPLRNALQFAINHFVLLTLWELPAVGLLLIVTKDKNFSEAVLFGQVSAFTIVLVLLLSLIIAFGPTLCALPAACADSLVEALHPALWKRVLVERLDDVLFFYVCVFGSLMMFTAIYAIPVAIIALLVPSELPPLPTLILRLPEWLLPLAAGTTPVLIGRLAGAFAYVESGGGEPSAASIKTPNALSGSALSTPSAAVTQTPTAGAPAPGAPSQPLKPPTRPLSPEAHTWVEEDFRNEPLIIAGYLFERLGNDGNYERKIGLELDSAAGMAERQKLFMNVSGRLSQSPVAVDGTTIALLNETTRVVIQRIGQLVYRKG